MRGIKKKNFQKRSLILCIMIKIFEDNYILKLSILLRNYRTLSNIYLQKEKVKFITLHFISELAEKQENNCAIIMQGNFFAQLFKTRYYLCSYSNLLLKAWRKKFNEYF